MARTVKARSGQGALVLESPKACPEPMRFRLWDTFGATDVAPEISVEHPRVGQRSYFPESEYQVLDSSIEGLEISIDDGAWRPCVRGDGCWSYEWAECRTGRGQAVVRIRPRRKGHEARNTCLFLVELP